MNLLKDEEYMGLKYEFFLHPLVDSVCFQETAEIDKITELMKFIYYNSFFSNQMQFS